MSIDIHVPTLGESVSDATIARWIKKAGETVAVDEPVVELETDKVTLEVPSPVAGILAATFALAMLVVQTCMCIRDIQKTIHDADSAAKNDAANDWKSFCKHLFSGVLGIDQKGSIASQLCLKLSAFIVLFAVEYAVGMSMLKSLGTITASATRARPAPSTEALPLICASTSAL